MKKLNLPDWLSVYRMVAVPVIIGVLVLEKEQWFIWLILLSLATDIADGAIARRTHQTTQRGTKLDSIGDMLTLLLMVAGLFRFKMDFLEEHYLPLLVIAALYVGQLLFALLKFKQTTSFHTYLIKLAFLLLGVFYLVLFFYTFIPWLYYIAMIAMALSLVEEITLVAVLPEPKQNVQGLYWVWQHQKNQ